MTLFKVILLEGTIDFRIFRRDKLKKSLKTLYYSDKIENNYKISIGRNLKAKNWTANVKEKKILWIDREFFKYFYKYF